jgi:transcriptional regulator with XRE-family HTH domain
MTVPHKKRVAKNRKRASWTAADGKRLAQWRDGERHWSQQHLAEIAKLARESISAYEAARSTPDARTLLHFANAAAGAGDYPTASWFIKKSGVMDGTLKFVEQEASREFLQAPDDAVVRIPPANVKGQRQRANLLLDPRIAGRVGLTAHVAVAEGEAGDPLQWGGIVVLDESMNEAGSLAPFWGKVVLLEAETKDARRSITGLRWLIGKLLLRGHMAGTQFKWQILFQPWAAVERLGPYTVGHFVDESPLVGRGIKYGRWTNPDSFRSGMEVIEKHSREWAERHAALGDGFRILGIVTAVAFEQHTQSAAGEKG